VSDLNLLLDAVASRALNLQAPQTLPQAEPKWWATYVRTFANTARPHELRRLRQRWGGRADAKGSGCSAGLHAETDENAASFDEEMHCLLHCDGMA
jgi:hypothetical protein